MDDSAGRVELATGFVKVCGGRPNFLDERDPRKEVWEFGVVREFFDGAVYLFLLGTLSRSTGRRRDGGGGGGGASSLKDISACHLSLRV